jgi:hypothetical protein
VREGWKYGTMDFFGCHTFDFYGLGQVLFYIAQIHLRNVVKRKWETENDNVTFPTLKILLKKYQYSIQGGLCNVRHIQCPNPNNHPYGLFNSSGLKNVQDNFGPPQIEES